MRIAHPRRACIKPPLSRHPRPPAHSPPPTPDDNPRPPGNDTISGGDGDDLIIAGSGHDRVDAGDGDDAISAGAGNDTVQGGAGTDQIQGGDGNDKLWGDDSAGLIDGGSADTHADMAGAIDAAGHWAECFRDGKQPRWLTLTGPTGRGKTHIAQRLFTWAKCRSDTSYTTYIVAMIYWPGFVSELKAGQAYERLRDMATWPVLFLDDIGAERDTSGFATEQLNTLLGQRIDRWTILTSNLLLPQLAAIEPRIADRIIRPPNLRAELNCKSYARRKAIT
jgi:hypothetical protein